MTQEKSPDKLTVNIMSFYKMSVLETPLYEMPFCL
jgi:hypothetical protein